jgi:O-methyltransferase
MIKQQAKKLIESLGYEVRRKGFGSALTLPADMEKDKVAIIQAVLPYTMTSPERIYGLISAVDYMVDKGLEGDVVECGVWRGGSMLAAAMRLKARGATQKNLWLFDTYEGMPEPTADDFSKRSGGAQEKFEQLKTAEDASDWCRASLEDVQHNIRIANYPAGQIHFIKGKVEDTIPANIPEKIALLRLDTDWYASTKHELKHLFPRLVPGGVLIIDDYGHWEGCRKAVDEYFEGHKQKPLLVRVDYTGRMGIKPA